MALSLNGDAYFLSVVEFLITILQDYLYKAGRSKRSQEARSLPADTYTPTKPRSRTKVCLLRLASIWHDHQLAKT